MTLKDWLRLIWSATKVVFCLALVVVIIQQFTAPAKVQEARNALMDKFQQQRQSRVIAMIHRQEQMSFLGVPIGSSITIEDSEAVLRAIRLTPPDKPIDLILHTPGGLLLAAEQIAKALEEHKGRVTVFVPHYAMSGGTLLALAADQIVMDPNAVLGPVDPQIGEMPAASILRAVELKRPAAVSDETLMMADIAQKARVQTGVFVAQMLHKHMSEKKSLQLAEILTDGRFTHDFPIMVDTAKQLGLPITTDMPPIIYDLMDLYPQGGGGRPSVLYTPLRQPNMRKAPESPLAPEQSQNRGVVGLQ